MGFMENSPEKLNTYVVIAPVVVKTNMSLFDTSLIKPVSGPPGKSEVLGIKMNDWLNSI
jgi:hypothetical protein